MLKKRWTNRFVDITPRLAAQAAFVFIGENAEKADEFKWPTTHIHGELQRVVAGGKKLDVTTKIYLFGMADIQYVMASFRTSDLLVQMNERGATEAYVEWTLMRKNARIACARASEEAVWGFGRPHPRKPNFKPHQDLAGPLVDYRPGTKEWWVFEPVIMKVLPSLGEEYYMEVVPQWTADGVVVIGREPEQIPPQLEAYKFSGTSTQVSPSE